MRTLIPTKHIDHNPCDLTDEEVAVIKAATFYMYTYGVGLIFLDNATWDCTNSAAAKDYLDELKIPEKK
jgi:hypothetical protein